MYRTGSNKPGYEQLARIGNTTSPLSRKTAGAPAVRSLAITARGICIFSNSKTLRTRARNLVMGSDRTKPFLLNRQRATSEKRMLRATASISSLEEPDAKADATIEPALTPEM